MICGLHYKKHTHTHMLMYIFIHIYIFYGCYDDGIIRIKYEVVIRNVLDIFINIIDIIVTCTVGLKVYRTGI